MIFVFAENLEPPLALFPSGYYRDLFPFDPDQLNSYQDNAQWLMDSLAVSQTLAQGLASEKV